MVRDSSSESPPVAGSDFWYFGVRLERTDYVSLYFNFRMIMATCHSYHRHQCVRSDMNLMFPISATGRLRLCLGRRTHSSDTLHVLLLFRRAIPFSDGVLMSADEDY